MAEKKVTAPPAMAGLVRYVEEEKSIIKIKPEVFLAVCTLFLFLELILELGIL